MEKSIKQALLFLRIGFVFFWVITAVILLLGETDGLPVGLYADDERMIYMLDSFAIILTAAC